MYTVWTIHLCFYIFFAPISIYETVFYFFGRRYFGGDCVYKKNYSHRVRLISLCVSYLPIIFLTALFKISFQWIPMTSSVGDHLSVIIILVIIMIAIEIISRFLRCVMSLFLSLPKSVPFSYPNRRMPKIPSCWLHNLAYYGVIFMGIFAALQRSVSEYHVIIINH